MTSLDEFCTTLRQLITVVKDITEIEQRRIDAASRNEHRQIESFLNEEQAALLSMRGLEQKRMHQAADLGWKDFTFRQILYAADSEQKKLLLPIFNELDEQISLLKKVRTSADRIIGLRIHELEEAIAAAGGIPNGTSSHFFKDRYI
ncbi:MAG: hypothetical protein IKV59_06215 [Lachnospiraceae bacterium]|nr:hypothetical protein [Lachnospiraceae bacterium]